MPPPTKNPSALLAKRLEGRRKYFNWSNPLEKGKWWLAIFALVGSLAWVAATVLGPRKVAPYTHGTLASVHAAWDTDCAQCHKNHPLGSTSTGMLDVRGRWRDFTCGNCHGEAPHHKTAIQKEPAFQECGNCHRDHNGRGFSLTRLPDTDCTKCHQNLKEHCTETPKYKNTITDFVTTHPEFAKLDQEKPAHKRHLKFSHSQHMTAGMSLSKGGQDIWTVGQVAASDRERYRKPGQSDKDAVQLECASCHKTDGDGKAATPGRGDYMAPINFDLHCKGCHPLKSNIGDDTKLGELTVPHHIQPKDLEPLLEKDFALRLIDREPAETKKILGGRLDSPERKEAAQAIDAKVKALSVAIRRNLYGEAGGVCTKCHDTKAPGKAKEDNWPLSIVSPGIPTVWFPSAKFNHAAHRQWNCADCHPGKDAQRNDKGETIVNEREPVGILGIDNCKRCHSPAKVGAPLSGVRHGCTDCHRYHNGDHPLMGLGAPQRDPAKKQSIDPKENK